jgi:hypothetical protein
MHVASSWNASYPKLIEVAIQNEDTDLLDYFASRAAMQLVTWGDRKDWNLALDRLTKHYEALPDSAFVQRASNALSYMPAFAISGYDSLLRGNALSRLLFERSTPLYLSNPKAVRDLLESPQIHVQLLAFRILSTSDDRAFQTAAQNQDLLQATLLRPLHRRSRIWAFEAIYHAACHDEQTATFLLKKMRDALSLPDKKYPKEELVELIAKVLCKWPSLRMDSEQPVIFGSDVA